MYVANRREANDLAALVNALSGSPKEGASVYAVASQTGLPAQRVAKLLTKHHDYFVKVGGREAFALNKFGKHRGASDKLLEEIEKSFRVARSLKTAGLMVGGLLTAGGAAGTVWSAIAPAPALLAPAAVLLIVGVVLLALALRF